MSEEGRPKRKRKATEHFQIEETTLKRVEVAVSSMLTRRKIYKVSAIIENFFVLCLRLDQVQYWVTSSMLSKVSRSVRMKSWSRYYIH